MQAVAEGACLANYDGASLKTDPRRQPWLDALAIARRDRLASQSSQLPTLFVIALSLAGFAVIANGAVMTASRPKTGRLIILLTAVVAVDVALVIMLWTPFGGSLQISDQPVLQVISELRSGLFN